MTAAATQRAAGKRTRSIQRALQLSPARVALGESTRSPGDQQVIGGVAGGAGPQVAEANPADGHDRDEHKAATQMKAIPDGAPSSLVTAEAIGHQEPAQPVSE